MRRGGSWFAGMGRPNNRGKDDKIREGIQDKTRQEKT